MRFVRNFDQWLAAAVKRLPASLKPTMESVSLLGQPFLVLSVGLAGFVSATIRHQTHVQQAFVYAAAAFLICNLIKFSLRRDRPSNLDIRTFGVKSYSFPSGHAFGTVIFYGLFSYLDLKFLAPPWNILISLVLWLVIFAIGVSRVYLKAHYPSDVLGGWLLGGLFLVIVINLAF